MIRSRLAAAMAMTLALATCGDSTVISNVDRQPGFKAGDLVAMQEPDGLHVEIHGLPWPGITDAEVADLLKPPAGSAQEVHFHSVPAGDWVHGRGHRLVLHFDSTTPPNSQQDCAATAEIPTKAPAETGFTVNASFCTKDKWQAYGYLQAPDIKAGDKAAFTRVMRQLFTAIFKYNPGK